MKKSVIIVAGGIGKRMRADIPKQFLLLNRKPILMHAIDCFYNFKNDIAVILVLPSNQIDYWKTLCSGHNFKTIHEIVEGGETRFHSVKNALAFVNDGIVAIHDGVRPFASKQMITRLFEGGISKSNAIPVIEITESLRIEDEESNYPLNRSKIKIVQTPQVFRTELIKKAYSQKYNSNFTDDATVLESIGEKINLIEGDKENIKITTSYDLSLAKELIKRFEY